MTRKSPTSDLIAAIDMGSNSFHMVVAQILPGASEYRPSESSALKILDTFGEKVQLAAGLDEQGYLSEDAQQRAFSTLQLFADKLTQLKVTHVVAVGTNTLRIASNSQAFLSRIEQILDCPVRVISGEEEARLIYQGVSMSQLNTFEQPLSERRLVVDIGGGSTEFIIGEGSQPKLIRSLQLGCVDFGLNYFKGGAITHMGYDAAVAKAKTILAPEVSRMCAQGWDVVIGSSGSVKSVQQVAHAAGLQLDVTTPETLNTLRDKIVELGHCSKLKFDGLRPDRRSIFPAGLAILEAIFQLLDIKMMLFSTAALREGLLYERLLMGAGQVGRVRNNLVS